MSIILDGTTGITTPDLIDSSLTSGRVVYAGASGNLTGSTALTFDGAILGVNGVSVGRGAGAVSTNTAVGASALAANTSGADNTAVGYQAGFSNTTGIRNTASGYQSFYTSSTGSYNTAMGWKALNSSTGDSNTGLGYTALLNTSTGASNTAIGESPLQSNTTGSFNTAVGTAALKNNNTASYNTAIGYQAGYSNQTGARNTIIGYLAGYNLTGSFNTLVGSGTSSSAGDQITSGTKNTVLGAYNGNQGGLDARTRNNEVILSDGDGNIMYRANGTATSNRWVNNDGTQFYPGTDNVISLGFSSNRWTTVYATTGTINTSDANQKQDIANLDDAEKRVAVAIKSLIKKYRFKDAVAKKGDAARIHIGAVAQEVQAAFVAEGLDPARYALFCSDTWYEVDGKPSNTAIEPYTADTPNSVQVTQLGLRYEELLAFVIAAL